MRGTYRAVGEIDGATAPAFDADLRNTIDCSDEPLVSVDCSGVTFMGSAGFRALAGATEYAARRGHTLVIRNPSPSCARLIRVCDRDGELRVDLLSAERGQGRRSQPTDESLTLAESSP